MNTLAFTKPGKRPARPTGALPGLAWASIPLILLTWVLLASRMPAYVLPQPWEVLQEGVRWWQDGSLTENLAASLQRELVGFALATSLALALGTTMGLSTGFRVFIGPVNSLFMSIPPIAWTPLIILFLGLGDASMLAVIVMAAVFPMAITIQEGVQSIQSGEVRAARTLGASRQQLLRHVYLPACLPFITAALRIGFSQAWRALVAAEMIGASKGIGWMVSTGGQIGNSSQVLLGISVIGVIAWLTESLVFRRLESRYSHWRGQ